MTLEALQALRKILAHVDDNEAIREAITDLFCGGVKGGLCGLRDQVDRETIRWQKAKNGSF